VIIDNRLIRFSQDDEPYYGNQVWASEIKTLTIYDYSEIKFKDRPILKGYENWNTKGMHHISLLKISNEKWIAVVDGH